MSTYYDILGISPLAGSTEIKRAFRRLAKIYHPDKNPRDKEVFAGILKAYETLIDPSKKAVYDRQITYSQKPGSGADRSGSKNWSFEERELKRRRYYEEHIKKYEKRSPVRETPLPKKNPYNEFKYILFATPLAVALLLLILRLASGSAENSAATESPVKISRMYTQEGPYSAAFGQSSFDTRRNQSLYLSNELGTDLVLCFFNADGFLRSCLIQKDESLELPQMPEGPYTIRYCSGKHFNASQVLPLSGQLGAFVEDQKFFKSIKPINGIIRHRLPFNAKTNQQFIAISEQEFFTLQ